MTHLIQTILGKKSALDLTHQNIDTISLHWYESTRRIMRKTSNAGVEVAFKLFKEGQSLEHDDVVFCDDATALVIYIIPCEVIVLSPQTLPEMARVCYEIGNKHAPLFLEGDEILSPPDEPFFRWLVAAGFAPRKEVRRLSHALRSNSAHGHGHAHGSEPHVGFRERLFKGKP